MILHIVLFKWRDGVTQAQIEALNLALAELPEAIPELEDFEYGPDLRYRTDNADYALVALFDDQAGWQTYQDHPAHKAVVNDHVKPILAQRYAIQMLVDEPHE